MNKEKHLLSVITLLLVVASLHGQPQYKLTTFSTDEGLPQRTITDIIQDKKGFIWLSTWNGITRFDAYSFVSYKKSADNSGAPFSTRINHIRESSTGDIWCSANDRRIYLFDTTTGNFIDILEPVEQAMKRKFEVVNILPLSKGVTWIICNQGFCFRIDDEKCKSGKGEGITSYSTFDGRLRGEIIYTVFQDYEGDEWILTDKGVTILGEKEFQLNFPFTHAVTYEDKLVLLTSTGTMAIYNFTNRQLVYQEVPLRSKTIYRVINNGNGNVSLSTGNGLLIYNIPGDRFTSHNIPSAFRIFADSDRCLWITTEQSTLIRLDPSTGKVESPFFRSLYSDTSYKEEIVYVYEDVNQNLWAINTKGEFAVYEKSSGIFRQASGTGTLNPNKESEFGSYFADSQDNLWIPIQGGLVKVTFVNENIKFYEQDKNYEARALMTDKKGNLWVGNKAGIIRIYNSVNHLTGYLSRTGKLVQQREQFCDSGIYCITEDSSGRIWVGSKGTGLFLLENPSEKGSDLQVTNYRQQATDPYSISSNEVYTVYEDIHRQLWIGCYNNGLNLVQENGRAIRFINHNNLLKSYPVAEFGGIRTLNGTNNGVILVGTTNGLLTFSSEFEQPESIRYYPNQADHKRESALSGNNVMHIFRDSRNDIYIITFDGGINKIIDKELLSGKITFKTLSELENGIIPDLTQSAIEDRKGHLWFFSEDDMIKYDPVNESGELFTRSSLMHNYYFSEAIPCLTASGQIAIGVEGGMLTVDPEQMIKKTYVPPVVFTEINIQGEQLDSPDHCERLTISPSERNIAFRFTALDYINAKSIRYAYRMAGLETEWNYVEDNRAVSYINLPRGNFRFQLKSTNSNGTWVENTREIPIHVLPRFGETVWAALVWALGIMALIGAIAYVIVYIYRLRYKLDFEKQLVNIKLRFFTDISHELRTPLTLITGPVTEVMEQENLSPTGREYLMLVKSNIDRMCQLINQILDFRKIQNKKMKTLVEYTDIVAILRKLMDDFRLIAEDKNIIFTLDNTEEELMCWVDRDKFEKIFFNLLSNAFKFTPPGKSITVKVTSNDYHIEVAVLDEGIGIRKELIPTLFERFESLSSYDAMQPSSGIGLSMVKELSNLLHADIKVQSHENRGSEFKIIFKKGDEHFREDKYVEFILEDNNGSQERREKRSTDRIEEEYNEDNRLTLLVVEDNPELSGFLNSILSRTYKVIEAENGKEGLKKANQELPDFIVTDVAMPVMDGLEMIRSIKENPDICHIPIIVLSSRTSLEDRIKGLEHGIDDYITKPFSATYLKARIASLIAQRRQLQEMYLSEMTTPDIRIDTTPMRPDVIPHDKLFIKSLMEFMETNMDNPELTVDDLAEAMQQSRSIFYRKLKSILGLTPIDFIREIRIKRAVQLIETGEFTFSQVAYMTGFNDSKYFGKCFKKQYGMTLSEYKARSLKK